MDEEEQFVSIDLNDDNVCSICKLDTDTGTLSFCHVCFELSIEGVPTATLLHSKSLRGHKDCFEKYHLIANQKLSRAKESRSTYEGMKNALSQKISRIIQYAQNRETAAESARRSAKHHKLHFDQQDGLALVPQSDSQVPRYGPRWEEAARTTGPECGKGMLEFHSEEEMGLEDRDCTIFPSHDLWPGGKQKRSQKQGKDITSVRPCRYPCHTREELAAMSIEELHQINEQLVMQLQTVFEELTDAVQKKDSLASELHVRHIAIEQLFKNCEKLPWLQVGRAGAKPGNAPVE